MIQPHRLDCEEGADVERREPLARCGARGRDREGTAGKRIFSGRGSISSRATVQGFDGCSSQAKKSECETRKFEAWRRISYRRYCSQTKMPALASYEKNFTLPPN